MKPYYEAEGVVLYHGDCLAILPELEAGSVDAVITDPPYGIDYQSAWRTDKTKRLAKIANDGQPFVWWLPEAFRVLRDGGCLVCFCRWDVQEAFRLAIEWAGFDIKSQVIWDRGAHGMGDLEASFAPQHDVIWFAVKGKFAFPGKRPPSVIPTMRLGGEALLHPNQKPVELMAYLIRSVTPPGGLVVEPFAGSGSTLVAAVRDGYRVVGYELDEAHFKTALGRLDYEAAIRQAGQPSLFGGDVA